MASTINITRALRVENEAGIVGAEAETVNAAEIVPQVISAGTEEQTAMGSFKDHQLQAMALFCDVAAEAQFLGVRYAILATVAGPPGTITHTGDLEQEIFPGDLVRVEGTVGDDGVYLVATVVENLGTTTITLTNGQALPAGGGGAVGTVARVCSRQILGYAYTAVTVTAATGAITFTGNLTDKFAAGDFLAINNSTGNDGIWEIDSVTYAPPTTTIVVNGGTLPDNTDDGVFHKVAPSFVLAANEPFIWSIKSGLQNPFIGPPLLNATDVIAPLYNADRGDVTYCMVNVPGAVNGNFAGRFCKDPII